MIAKLNFEIPDPESSVPTIYFSNGESFIRQNVSKSPVVINKTLVPTAVTNVRTLNERRYPQRVKRPLQRLDLKIVH